ncbi:MAG: hypothetical protein V4490_02470 [Pseudomonadota bacterium]
MFKKVTLFALSSLFFSVSQGIATFEVFEENPNGTIHGVYRLPDGTRINLQSVTDVREYQTSLAGLGSNVPGYPAVEGAETRFENQNVARQRNKNPYHLYEVFLQAAQQTEKHNAARSSVATTVPTAIPEFPETGDIPPVTSASDLESEVASTTIAPERISLGLVQFGRMPTKGYPEGIETPTNDRLTVHHAIINKFMTLGVTRQIDPAQGLGDGNVERIDNKGAAFVLPFFNPTTAVEHRAAGLIACRSFVAECAKGGHLLPVEKTLPHVLMALHHPEDRNVDAFINAGFTRDDNPVFGWFYPVNGQPSPRVMLTYPIRDSAAAE